MLSSNHPLWLIDVGNTSIKIGIYQQQSFRMEGRYFDIDVVKWPSNCHIALLSVSKLTPKVLQMLLENNNQVWQLTPHTPLPFQSTYQTLETLGTDRKALIAGAYKKWPSSLIISMGSCITYDVLNKGVHTGGVISPGWQMRLDAMHTQTANLPQIAAQNSNTLWGNHTTAAMTAGAYQGILAEMNYFIEQALQQNAASTVLITGSDAKSFENKLNCKIFAVEDLLFDGLKNIYFYNEIF